MNGSISQPHNTARLAAHLIAHINVKLALIGCQPVPIKGDTEFAEIVSAMAGSRAKKTGCSGIIFAPPTSASRLFFSIICRMCR